LWNFCRYFKLPWLFFLFIFTRKLVVFCKTLISICSASFRFFRYMELVVWARAATNWYFRGEKNDVICCCTWQIHTFLKILGGNCPIAPLWLRAWYVLSKTKNDKNVQKNFSLGPQKHVEFFCLHFSKVLDMVWFCMQNEFSAVFYSLSTGRWIKPLFCSKIVFFPAQHHKHDFKTTKDASSKTLLTMSYLLTYCSFSGSRVIAKIAMKCQCIRSRVNQLWHDFFANLPTDCIWWTCIASAHLKIAGAS